MYEKFEGTKGLAEVVNQRQTVLYSGQMKKRQVTINKALFRKLTTKQYEPYFLPKDSTQKTKDRATRTPLKIGDELICSAMVSRSCSTFGTPHFTDISVGI